MKTIKISPSCREITLGRQGENAATVVEFDVSILRQTYGDGTPYLFHRRSCDAAAYPVAITTDGDTVRWVVTAGDTAHRTSATHGQAEMHWIVDETLAKSVIWRTYVAGALETGGDTPPDAVTPWYNQLLDAIEDIRHSGVTEDQLQQAIESWMKEHPAPAGEKGDKGDDYVLTDSDREEIAGDAAEKIKPEIDKVKEDLATKIDKPSTAPAVGKILKVTEVNDDGTFTCEWADAPSGGGAVDDVQVNGNSIVQDGVANVPFAKPSDVTVGIDAAGVIIPWKTVFSMNGHGVLSIVTPSMSAITNRYTGGRPLTLDNIDYAVKAAMCDGKGAAWDTASQLDALARLGITVDDDGICRFG